MVTKLSGTAAYPTRWEVASHTDFAKKYVVSQKPDSSWGCSCPRWIFNKDKPRLDCKHILEVKVNEPIDYTRTSKAAAKAFIDAIAVRKTNVQMQIKPSTAEPVYLLQTRRAITLED